VRCYFIRNKWIEAVYMLKPGPDETWYVKPKNCSKRTPARTCTGSRCGLAAVSSIVGPQALRQMRGSFRTPSARRDGRESLIALGKAGAGPMLMISAGCGRRARLEPNFATEQAG